MLGIAGCTCLFVLYSSMHWIFESESRGDIEIVAIVEPNRELAKRYAGQHGYDGYTEESLKLKERTPPYDDPFSLFTAIVRGQLSLKPYDLSSLENNMIVKEILDAAIRSAESGQMVYLSD